jgi:hypothetical protein
LWWSPPPESNRRPHPYHSCGPSPIEEWAQVRVTRVTVSDRQEPPETAPYGTQMARWPASLNLVPHGGRHRPPPYCKSGLFPAAPVRRHTLMTPPALDPLTMGRLALIRLLYLQGLEQSRLPQPVVCSSVLTFHDTVELFLGLTADRLRSVLRASTSPSGAP